ncbi:hypothetical protein Dimus_033894 [Dionaea muscipula]
MEFEEGLLMQPREVQVQSRRLALKEEVEELQEKLNGELRLNSVLRYALRGPALSCHRLSFQLPLEVQTLLAELALVEEEILLLERKMEKLQLSRLSQEKQQMNKEGEYWWKLPRCQWKPLPSSIPRNHEIKSLEWLSVPLDHQVVSKQRILDKGRISVDSAAPPNMHSFSSTRFNEGIADRSRSTLSDIEIGIEKPNRLSEELLKCLIGIFLKMNHSTLASEGTSTATRHTLSCINSKAFAPKTTFNCKVRSSFNNDNLVIHEPHSISSSHWEAMLRDTDPPQNTIQITRTSLSSADVAQCKPAIRKMRVLMQQLCKVDLTLLTYKQKLAFWINIYNSCIMHAYLQHGLPSNQERMLALMNKAAVNVGGIVLNALAIEHYILRHPDKLLTYKDPTDEKEMLLRHAYGLRYPEPNVTFTLSRGNWSSPAVKVYTPDEVVNELGRAKVEYLESSVEVTNKKKIRVPKLLQWHMHDFADDMESLIEWIYSQLPYNGVLKGRIMECLNGETKVPVGKMVEIVPYDYEFRYLLPASVRGQT